MGCTVTPLANVKKSLAKRGWRTFERIHDFPETVPLRCLADCPNIAFRRSQDNDQVFLPRFQMEARVYERPWSWISEMGHLTSFSQMPSEFYNHDIGLYPKRILLIETGEDEFNKQR